MRYLILLVAFVTPGAAAAQLASVSTGSRVRVAAPSVQRRVLTGTLMQAIGDSVMIAVPARGARLDSAGLVERYAIPTARVDGLEVSEGRSRSAGARRGAKIGFLGATAFMLLTAAAAPPPSPEGGAYGGFAVLGALVVGGLSAAGGAVVGGIIRAEKWRCVFPPESARQKFKCQFARPNPTTKQP